MFLVPGFIPQEAKELEGKRGLSQSERDCGDAKLWRRLLLSGMGDDVTVWDMEGTLRKREGRLVVVVGVPQNLRF